MTAVTQGNRSKELAKGLFGGLKEAKARIDSNWEREGHYFLRIDNVKIDSNRQGQTAVFVEKTVIHVLDDADGTGHRVGDSITHAMWSRFDSFLGNVKGFLSSVLGMAQGEIDESHVDVVTADDQPLAGTVIECQNRTIMTKAEKPFTVINYKGEVPATQLMEVLSDRTKEIYFPGDILQRMAELEAEFEEGEEGMIPF